MHLFIGATWTDLATAAVACMSVAGVWATFWPGHRERLRQGRQRRLEHLRKINHQLEHIGNWARSQYDESSHSHDWYNAGWAVNEFPREDVEHFNQVVIAGAYRRALTTALARLELAAERFHRMLADQIEYRMGAHDPVASARIFIAARDLGTALTPEALAAVEETTAADRDWSVELYRQNKDIHVSGIGIDGQEGLHDAWRAASEQLVAERTALQSAGDPGWRWAGHLLAIIFAGLGLLFLIDFAWSFADDVRRRAATAGQALEHPGAASTQTPAETSSAAPDDTSRAVPAGTSKPRHPMAAAPPRSSAAADTTRK